MNRPITAVFVFCFSLSSFAWIPKAEANITITASESGGNVIFSYSGTVKTVALEPLYGPFYSGITGRVAPNTSLLYFADSAASAPNALRYYNDPVNTAPTSLGSGSTATPSSFTGSYFVVTPLFVGVPANYISDSQISGTMTFIGTTLESLGFDTTPGAYTWTLTNLETVTLRFGATPGQLDREAVLKRKLASAKLKLRLAKRNRNQALAKRLQISITRIKAQLREF